MNKKVASEIAIGVLLLIAIAVGGVFWVQSKKQEATVSSLQRPTAQPVIVQNEEQPQQQTNPVVTSTDLQIYTNTKYGFKLKIPADWKNYLVEDISRDGQIGTDLAFELPTSDPEWLKIGEKRGIAFDILIVSDNDIKNINHECKNETSGIFCLFDKEKIGRNSKYTFYFHHGPKDRAEYPNDFPVDYTNQKDEIAKSITFID